MQHLPLFLVNGFLISRQRHMAIRFPQKKIVSNYQGNLALRVFLIKTKITVALKYPVSNLVGLPLFVSRDTQNNDC
jgi:hypothetical protein